MPDTKRKTTDALDGLRNALDRDDMTEASTRRLSTAASRFGPALIAELEQLREVVNKSRDIIHVSAAHYIVGGNPCAIYRSDDVGLDSIIFEAPTVTDCLAWLRSPAGVEALAAAAHGAKGAE